MKKLLLCGFFALLLPSLGYSQYYNDSHSEFIAGAGASQFLGDLGGSPQIGTHFLKDMNLQSTRYGGELGYRRRINNSLYVKALLTVGDVAGNDALSSNNFRHDRNQNFQSIIIEPSVDVEFYFYKYKNIGHRYKIRHAHGYTTFPIDAYIFAGVGGLYFNPQGEYRGQWYDLRPFSTEGEGLPGGPAEYSQFALTLPAGIGAKYFLGKEWSIGLELSTRLWTSTDYIDDTHGNYFSPLEIENYKGPIAAYFSHPVLGDIPGQDIVGTERGDPNHNDSYMFLMFNVNYQPGPHRRRGRSRSKF